MVEEDIVATTPRKKFTRICVLCMFSMADSGGALQALTGAQQWVTWHRNIAAERAKFIKVIAHTSDVMFLYNRLPWPVPFPSLKCPR